MADTPDNFEYNLAADRASSSQAERLQAGQANAEDAENPQAQERVPMGWAFFLFLVIISLILDVVDFFTGGTIGWVIGILGDLFLAAISGMSKSGRKQFKKLLVGFLGETILPVIDVLPFRTTMVVWAFASSRSTKLQQISAAASSVGKIS